MAVDYVDLNNDEDVIDTSLDNKVVLNVLDRLHGPVLLDCSAMPADVTVVKAGHVIIKKDGIIAPMPLAADGTAYAALPDGWGYAGIQFSSRARKRPLTTVVTRGTVNVKAAPYPYTDAIKTALSHIIFE